MERDAGGTGGPAAPQRHPLYGAALRPDAMDARQADYSRCALAIGSEGRGLSREVLDLCDKTVLIPMSPAASR